VPLTHAEGNDDLRQFIISQIRKEGPATFARFMEWCLYHPAYGYYGSGEARIGREGDYYTAPCVHPFFGGMVAKQLSQMSGILGSETFTVWEIGGGRGLLCEAIVAWAKKNDPSFYDRLAYCIVEPSPRFLTAAYSISSMPASNPDVRRYFRISSGVNASHSPSVHNNSMSPGCNAVSSPTLIVGL